MAGSSGTRPSFDSGAHNEATAVMPAHTHTEETRLARASDTPPTLLLLNGPTARIGEQWPLDRIKVTVGRTPGADLYLDDKSLSKLHMTFHSYGEAVLVVDLASTNGTAINGVALKAHEPVRLKDNDQIKAGNVLLKYLAAGSMEAVAAKELYDRLRVDPMTGLYNKGALISKVPDALQQARFNGWPLGVSVYDLDHFKRVNDTFGHDAGDHVLQEMAKLARQLARPEDYVARFGGEEFVVLHERATESEVLETAEKVRRAVEAFDFSYKDQRIALTVSIGSAMLPPEVADWDALFKRADQALYQSKQGGRNRVTLAP